MPLGSLFNDDIFISYSRYDGGEYARGLDKELTERGFSCFTDIKGTEAGKKPPPELYRRIRSSQMLIFLGTEGAVAQPQYVAREVIEFAQANGTLRIVPISFDRGEKALAAWESENKEGGGPKDEQAKHWLGYVEGKARVREKRAALESGIPSPEVIDRILQMASYTKSKDRLRRYRNGALAVFVVLLLASGTAAVLGAGFARDARLQGEKAKRAEIDAEARIRKANETAEQAERLAADADQKRLDAEALTLKAQETAATAEAATRTAEAKRLAAEGKTRAAELRQQRAEAEAVRQQGVAGSRERASASSQLRMVGADKILEAVRTAQDAVAQASQVGAATAEADMALRAGLAMLPALRTRSQVWEADKASLSPDAGTLAVLDPRGDFRIIAAESLLPEGQDGTRAARPNAPAGGGAGARGPARPVHASVPRDIEFAVSDGGGRLAGARGRKVLVFDSQSGEKLCEFETPEPAGVGALPPGEDEVASVALSPDGRYVAVAANFKTGSEMAEQVREYLGVVSLWYVNAGAKRAEMVAVLGEDFNPLSHVAFGPTGRVLAAGGRGGAILWDLGKVRDKVAARAVVSDAGEPEEDDLFGATPTPTPTPSAEEEYLNQLLATRGPAAHELEGATASDFERVVAPRQDDEVVSVVAPGPDLERVALAVADKVVVLRRAAIGGYEPSAYLPLSRPVSGLVLGGGTLSVVSISSWLASGGGRGQDYLYEVWHSSGYTAVAEFPSDDQFLAVGFTDDDALFALTQDEFQKQKGGLIWPAGAATGDEDDPRPAGFGGQFEVVEEDGMIYVRGRRPGEMYPLFPTPPDDPSVVQRIALSEDGALAAELPATSGEGRVRFFRRKGGRYEPRGAIEDFSGFHGGEPGISRDGRFFAYINSEGKLGGVKFDSDRDAARVRFDERRGDLGDVSSLQFSPKGRYLAALVGAGEGLSETGIEGTLFIFRTGDGAALRKTEYRANVNDITFSDDERFVAVAVSDRTAHVINVATGDVRKFTHLNFVYEVAFGPRAETLATASIARDETESSEVVYGPRRSVISVFDLRRGAGETARFFQDEYIEFLSFSRDGKYLTAAGQLERQGAVGAVTSYRAVVWNVRTDDLMAEATNRLKCIAGDASDCAGAGDAPE